MYASDPQSAQRPGALPLIIREMGVHDYGQQYASKVAFDIFQSPVSYTNLTLPTIYHV